MGDLLEKEQESKEVPVIQQPEPEVEFININKAKSEKFTDEVSEYRKLLQIKKNNLIYDFEQLALDTKKKKIYL